MNHGDIIKMLIGDFYEDFARTAGEIVIESDSIEVLVDIAVSEDIEKFTGGNKLTPQQRSKLCFRSAYVTEYIFFNKGVDFTPYYDKVLSFYPRLDNASACRHFSKMITSIVKHRSVDDGMASDICETAIKWIESPKTKVAVKVWCMELVIWFRMQLDWVDEIIPDIMEILKSEATPGMKVALRRWRDLLSE